MSGIEDSTGPFGSIVISEDQALSIANDSFPHGPEAIVGHIGAVVHHSPLSGCEGWCWRNGDDVVIRVNSISSEKRQRFTLAHELAHVIHDTQTGVVTAAPFESTSEDERAADKLAAKLLLPSARVISIIGDHLPIDASTLTRLGKAANVSNITAACRVVGMAEDLGLQNAAVAFFDARDAYQWRYSEGLRFPNSLATKLLKLAIQTETPSTPLRIERDDGKVIAASVIDMVQYKALFLQLLPMEVAENQSAGERLSELRSILFNGEKSLEQRVAGYVAYTAHKHSSKTVSEAMAEFDSRYMERDDLSAAMKKLLLSPEGREFLRLRLSTKCRPDEG